MRQSAQPRPFKVGTAFALKSLEHARRQGPESGGLYAPTNCARARGVRAPRGGHARTDQRARVRLAGAAVEPMRALRAASNARNGAAGAEPAEDLPRCLGGSRGNELPSLTTARARPRPAGAGHGRGTGNTGACRLTGRYGMRRACPLVRHRAVRSHSAHPLRKHRTASFRERIAE